MAERRRIWQISENPPIFIVHVGSPKGKERYSYEHFNPKESVFRGSLVQQIPLSKSQFKAVLAILQDLGPLFNIEVKYLGER